MDVAEVRPHVAGRPGVGQEERLFVGYAFGNPKTAHIGVRYSDVLGVRTGVAAEGVGVAVDSGGRIAEERLLQLRVRVGVVAQRVEVPLTVPAPSARDKRRHHHPLARFNLFDLSADFDDFTHKLVADNVARAHRRDKAVDKVQVGAAGRRQGDL